MPAVSKIEALATVGVVFHLQGVKGDATLQITLKNGDKGTKISLKDVLAGKMMTLWNGTAELRLISTALPVVQSSKFSDDYPAAAYATDGTLWLAHIRYHDTEPERRIEHVSLAKQPANFKAFDTSGFGESVMVQTNRLGKWSEPVPVRGGTMEDIAGCAVTCDQKGNAWVAYAAQRDGNFDIYARLFSRREKAAKSDLDFGPERRLTKGKGPDVHPVMTTDTAGTPWLACQSWDEQGKAGIQVFQCVGGEWQARGRLGNGKENCWNPVIAAGLEGRLAVAYDVYHNGNYDVVAETYDAASAKFVSHPVAMSPKFEARPSIVYDKEGRLWVAYEEGPEKWGKDYGALAPGKGNPLYNERSVRVVCLESDGSLKKPKAELPTARYDPPVIPFEQFKTSRYERTTRYSNPQLGLDGKGRVWLTYRQNFGSRYTTNPGSYWLTFARCLEDSAWSEPIELHHSDGLLDQHPVLLPHAGGSLLAIHNTDGRNTTPEHINNQLFVSMLTLPNRENKIDLVPHTPGSNLLTKEVSEENAAAEISVCWRSATNSRSLSSSTPAMFLEYFILFIIGGIPRWLKLTEEVSLA